MGSNRFECINSVGEEKWFPSGGEEFGGREGRGDLAVSVFAIADAGDFYEVVAEVAEENAVVLCAESEEWWFDTL